ncbi:flagellar basal-body rod protein FlgF [Ectothiorhodospira shaposhnikovii]|uniref:flagellar basal-body rod protein FlgF n=1 Tax=Ectothiorhodospira shaposhnikovii TaxID=1054 RepID=UPI0019031F92|nr:flagellar basal-body rod protein FlgF [Ectothiorhodospira shaposhnikovii]MBK1673450.1 flagellar basal-body rod protein FlgF [Ectothiorhodospira shaposhnikovii]
MDRMLYIAMTGAREAAHSQQVNTHNLANANTTGFRKSLEAFTNHPLRGPVYDSRDYAQLQAVKADFTSGPQIATGRDLDVAVQGDGWIAVQAPDGGEAYTRAGNFQVNSVGLLTTGDGLPVLGEDGPLAIPPFESIEIGADGTLSIRPLGQEANVLAEVGRVKLVNPDLQELARGEDGLFRRADGAVEPADVNVSLASGMLEGSNVNTIEAMVNMIELARNFETHVKLMKTAEDLDRSSSQLLRIS